MEKSNITLFHQEFYFSGGAEHTIFEEIQYLQNHNFNVRCYAPLVSIKTCFPDRIAQYPIHSFLPYFPFIPRELTILCACIIAPLLVLRFKNTTLFFGANQAGPYFAYIASLIHKKPYIVYMPYPVGLLYPRKVDSKAGLLADLSLPGKLLLKIVKPLIKYIDYKILKNASAVITEGSYSQKLFENIYNRKIINAPPGTITISADEHNTINRWEGIININGISIQKPYVLMTNRHQPKKMFEYSIDLAEKLKQNPQLQNIKIVISGEKTQYTQKIIKQAKNKNVDELLFFTDYTSEEDTQRLYKNAAVYIYTAPEEDFGKGIVQAMGYGVPSVAWNNAGPSGIILNNKTGYLITPFDTEEFSEKTINLILNKQLNRSMSQNAINHVKENFSKEKHEEIIVKTINTVLFTQSAISSTSSSVRNA